MNVEILFLIIEKPFEYGIVVIIEMLTWRDPNDIREHPDKQF